MYTADSPANLLLQTKGPPFLYGTAWKKSRTTDLVKQAVAAGFLAIDTAAQPKHYQEHLVGAALRELYAEGLTARSQLFVQTKFTPLPGQDRNDLPYDPAAPLAEQIRSSVASSLRNLRPREEESSVEESYIDCLILHSPLSTPEQTREAWGILESYHPSQIRHLGISNMYDPAQLQLLYDRVKHPPRVVQNRFYGATGWDAQIREFCREKGVVYESFWTLTGNKELLVSEPVEKLAREAGVGREAALYSLVMSLGVAVLNGTTNAERMRNDLRDVERIKNWSFVYAEKWRAISDKFGNLIAPE